MGGKSLRVISSALVLAVTIAVSASQLDAVEAPLGDPAAPSEVSPEESAAPEVGKFEIPVADPRYMDGVEILPFESPPEFLNHAFPAEPQYVDPQIKAREARGLDGDAGLVARLVSTPGATEQLQAYGVVLTQAEEALLLNARTVEDAVREFGSRLQDEPGFGGIRMNWAGPVVFSEPTVTVWVTADRAAWVKDEFESWPLDVPVDFEIVRSSLQELQDFARLVTGSQREGERVLVLAEQSDAVRSLVEAVRELPYAGVGFSVVNNEVTVELKEGEKVVAIDNNDPSTPYIHVIEHRSVKAAPGEESCNPQACDSLVGGRKTG